LIFSDISPTENTGSSGSPESLKERVASVSWEFSLSFDGQ